MIAVINLLFASMLLFGAPGPGPLALASSGARFGFRQSLPFLLGILSGLLVAGLGSVLGTKLMLSGNPILLQTVKIIGLAYILYLAWKIGGYKTDEVATKEKDETLSLYHGFILNLLNPKAWAVFVILFTQFPLGMESPMLEMLVSIGIAMAGASVVDIIWLSFGDLIRQNLHSEIWHKRLNYAFSAALVFIAILAFLTF